MSAIFELDQIRELPLWAQVLIAARMARRAILHFPGPVAARDRKAMLGLCDHIDAAARTGEVWADKTGPIAARVDAMRGGKHGDAATAAYLAWDAAGAAHGAQCFPVDAVCIAGVQNALAAASRSSGLNPLQVRIFAAADLDLLRFACGEAHIGFYDPLGSGVFARLTPVL